MRNLDLKKFGFKKIYTFLSSLKMFVFLSLKEKKFTNVLTKSWVFNKYFGDYPDQKFMNFLKKNRDLKVTY